jgi:phosphoribosylaminoimidazole-succinocarboxamide synthase
MSITKERERATVMSVSLPGRKKISSGKVRELFEAEDGDLLMVATDRISAFDVIMREGVPDKGKILTAMSVFWFEKTAHIIGNHLISANVENLPAEAVGRTLKILRCQPLPIECIVRGYLAGSGWKEYQNTGTVGGHKLPAGLVESRELPEPLFTPSTKAASGHDESITIEQARSMLGETLFVRVQSKSLELYQFARRLAHERGIIIADTKFEFGLRNGELLLIDEALTPDSSRFWPLEHYRPGGGQPSFDKQYLRDYLETCGWDKNPPPPPLPTAVVANTRQKYIEAYEKITGRPWAVSHAQG